MRDYATPAGFRAAVETKLRHRARQLGVCAYIVRRQAGLETRLGGRARVSVDLDADHLHGTEAARADLQRAAVAEAGDHFDFAVTGTEEFRSDGVGLAVRYKLASSLGYRREAGQVKVTPGLQEAHRLLAGWIDPILAGRPSLES